jgi:hypothetical protein
LRSEDCGVAFEGEDIAAVGRGWYSMEGDEDEDGLSSDNILL